jgi:hypothetical protein
MTILVATKRSSFAILGSERMESWPDKPSREGDCKIVWHKNPSIPLACGVTTGNSCWVSARGQRGRLITEFLEELAGEVRHSNELELSRIADRVKAKLQPGHAEMQRDAAIAIALFRDGKADIGYQHIGVRQDLEDGCNEPLLPLAPSELKSYCTAARVELLHDQSNTSANEVVELVRRFVFEGIEYERNTVPADKRQCGGKVDVVLVDAGGAKKV